MHQQVCRSAIKRLPPTAQQLQAWHISNSAKHALKPFGTTTNSEIIRLAQPLLPVAQWLTNSSTSRLRVEINRSRLKLDHMSLGNIAATSDLHSSKVLNNIYSAQYASRRSAQQLMNPERYSYTTFALRPGKLSGHASICLLHYLSVEDLDIPQRMRWYTIAPQIMSWDQRHSHRLLSFQYNTSRWTCLLCKVCVEIFWDSLSYSSALPRIHVKRQLSCTFQPLRPYQLMIIPTPLIKRQYIRSAIHVWGLPLCNYVFKCLHYSSNGISFELYHFFHYCASCLINCLF